MVENQDPQRLSGIFGERMNSEKSSRILEAISILQDYEKEYIGKDEVTVPLKSNDPLMLVCASDLHIGSLATDHKAVIELRDLVLGTDNAMVVFLGDEIEGMKEKYMNTNTARAVLDMQKQFDFLSNEILVPLANADKVAGIVSGYFGHVGWAEDATTINPWLILARLGGFEERIIRNGGKVNLEFPNGYTHSEMIWHNPPGKSKIDTVYGLRNAAFATAQTNRADGYLSGHIHRMGVGKELYSGSRTAVYYISSGTAKGSSGEVPVDRFGVKLGLPKTDPLGQGVIIEPKVGNKREKSFPFASFEQGKTINNALRLLDWVEKQGMTAELLEKIRAEVEAKPVVTFASYKSRTSSDEFAEEKPAEMVKNGGEWIRNPYSDMKMRAPYDSLTYDVKTKLPITLHLVSNARLGSSSEGYEELKKYHQEQIIDNPHSLVIFLRNMIDKEAGASPMRMEILDKFKDIINGAKEQTLAIMMCESLRDSDWNKQKKVGEEWVDQYGNVVNLEDMDDRNEAGDDEEEERLKKVKLKKRNIYSNPIAPGSYLANETDTPLIHHLSLVKLTIGPNGQTREKPRYVGAFADKLMHHGSYSRPEFGLKRMYDLYLQEKPGYVAGGHMPHAGSMMFYDGSNAETKTPILIAPGWLAKYVDTMGKGNVMPGASAGQAIIFMPGSCRSDYFAYPTVNAEETRDTSAGLTILTGLEILGLTESVLGKRGGR